MYNDVRLPLIFTNGSQNYGYSQVSLRNYKLM